MPDIPREKSFDSTLAFLREGYRFISNRCDRLNTDIFSTRITLTPVICLRGADAAGMFYGEDRFTRHGAMPKMTLRLLQDEGSVQALDDEAHRQRKRMFMGMMSDEAIAGIAVVFADEWRRALSRWENDGEVKMHDAVGNVLTRTALRWTGVPLAKEDIPRRKSELMAMIENAGSFGPSHIRARFQRRTAERWAADLIRTVRKGGIVIQDAAPLARIAHHRDIGGYQLADDIAAVELLNLLRPIVAIGRFIVFAALALHRHPLWRERFAKGDLDDLEPFVQEVRRHSPFFPVIGGRVRKAFTWRGYAFPEGHWVLLDLYGTNHDSRIWPEPGVFRPERFRNWPGDPNTLVPQGAGSFATGHRCPGERITIKLLKEAVRLMCQEMRYEVPAQDLTVELRCMPALPRSKFVIGNVKRTKGGAERMRTRLTLAAMSG